MSVWYWPEFDEILLIISNQVMVDFDWRDIDPELYPRLSLSGCIYIGDF